MGWGRTSSAGSTAVNYANANTGGNSNTGGNNGNDRASSFGSSISRGVENNNRGRASSASSFDSSTFFHCPSSAGAGGVPSHSRSYSSLRGSLVGAGGGGDDDGNKYGVTKSFEAWSYGRWKWKRSAPLYLIVRFRSDSRWRRRGRDDDAMEDNDAIVGS